MRRYTFHLIWLILTIAAFCSVFRGPIWGYPIAMFLAFVFAIIVAGYPSDSSLRRTLALIGLVLAAGGLTGLASSGLTPVTIHGSVPLLLLGSACAYSALFPWVEHLPPAEPIELSPRKFPSDGPPCPKCSMPTRTPQSLQCLDCGADWRGRDP